MYSWQGCARQKKYLAQAIQRGHRHAFPCLNPHYIVTLPVAAVAPECTQFVTTSPEHAMYMTDKLLLAARDLFHISYRMCQQSVLHNIGAY